MPAEDEQILCNGNIKKNARMNIADDMRIH